MNELIIVTLFQMTTACTIIKVFLQKYREIMNENFEIIDFEETKKYTAQFFLETLCMDRLSDINFLNISHQYFLTTLCNTIWNVVTNNDISVQSAATTLTYYMNIYAKLFWAEADMIVINDIIENIIIYKYT